MTESINPTSKQSQDGADKVNPERLGRLQTLICQVVKAGARSPKKVSTRKTEEIRRKTPENQTSTGRRKVCDLPQVWLPH